MLGDAPAVIPVLLRPEHVAFRRRKDEGEKKLSERPEFATVDDDVEEKRTIKVVSTTPTDGK